MLIADPKTVTLQTGETVEVSLEKSVEPEVVQGLEKTVTKDTQAPRYSLEFRVCRRCGEEVANDRSGAFKCGLCGNTEHFTEIKHKINQESVASILGRKAEYKCTICNKRYPKPTKCCVYDRSLGLIERPQASVKSFWCSKCNSVYAMRVPCCDRNADKLIAGTFIKRS